MKLLLVLMVCAAAAAAPEVKQLEPQVEHLQLDSLRNSSPETDTLVQLFIFYVRFIITYGYPSIGVPPLDPLQLDSFHLVIPAGLLNLDLDLKNIRMDGLSRFEVRTGILNLRDMTFDLDISVPVLDIRAENYKLDGDFFTAIPLYGDGEARFVVEGFRFQTRLHLKQSDDRRSVLIDRMEGLSFNIPKIKSELTGAIGGGDIDAIVNAMIEDVIVGYINRFQGAISLLAGPIATSIVNPILDQLDTWRYILPFLPRNLVN